MGTTVPLLREELVEASVMRVIASGLADYGLIKQVDGFVGDKPNVVLREAFPTPDERGEELLANTLAFGFNSDDGGVAAELGTTLTKYVHTQVAWVFGLDMAFSRKVAQVVKHIVRRGQGEWGTPDTIPLLDFNADPENPPQIDLLMVLSAHTEHQGNTSVRPWDRYLYTCTVEVQDIYYVT